MNKKRCRLQTRRNNVTIRIYMRLSNAREFRRGSREIGFARVIGRSRDMDQAMWCNAMRCTARARALELSRHHRSSSLSLSLRRKKAPFDCIFKCKARWSSLTSRGRAACSGEHINQYENSQCHSREAQKRPKEETLLYGVSRSNHMSPFGRTHFRVCIRISNFAGIERALKKSCRSVWY